ncbi:hypothetical protein BN7_2073 [Wickerhamomyces ciferrii]|uniref:NADH dehydrogenase (Ubiquinone) complex I, assembly factor 6 n=1 Tax=Wickerhamomyces ciferrii (strain ATCC 14091 / BCRC 22168 / CBS 111 / JCM 3599 / NBRC 0793 / NRRL Y-1031 F-60-10) TaxID=1206466 RepID=K0KMC4_WICCF|nr:uncharacterized protein BN7_2073 [Wickerhamomyces ciferrii]CCH42529.1 hypothetical protein BN7_2073 [Wickerhamomyces ciferrii]
MSRRSLPLYPRGFNFQGRALQKRFVSTAYESQISKARVSCLDSLHKYDKSSYVLSAYIPKPARDYFIAIRAFNIEISKISNSQESQVNRQLKSTIGVSSNDLKFKFWEDLIFKVFQNPYSDQVIGEPVALLIRDGVRNDFNLTPDGFNQILSTRKDFLSRSYFQNVDQLSSYGEGLHSQLNYMAQNLMLSNQLSPSTINLVEESTELQDLITEISAHLGQATGIASLVIGTKYYAQHKNQINLPIDIMTKYDLSQELLLRLFQGHEAGNPNEIESKLKDVIYETCIGANDHLISAREKFKKVKKITSDIISSTDDDLILMKSKSWKRQIPDCLFVPFMTSIPLDGYLSQLEHNDFDILSKKIENPYWKIVWRSYWNYQRRIL